MLVIYDKLNLNYMNVYTIHKVLLGKIIPIITKAIEHAVRNIKGHEALSLQ
jgi:hypothetical protein